MTAKKYTDTERRNARKAGFKRKAPKKPKMSSKSPEVYERYISRYNEWVDQMKAKAKDYARTNKLKEAVRKI